MQRHVMMTAFAIVVFTGCATAGSYEMSDKTAQRLAEFERTGEIDNCLSVTRINQITALDEWHFLIRTGVNNYYLNELDHKCSGAGRSFHRIQYTISGSQLCRNEIITIVDNSSGFTVGSCGLNGFERLEKKTDEDASG